MNLKTLLSVLTVILFAGYAFAQPAPVIESVASNFNRPVKVTHANDSRLFVAEIGGKIKVVKNGMVIHDTPFLDISDKINDPEWAGIYSIVFHPNYQINGYFYVMYVLKGKTEVQISRFQRAGNQDSDVASSDETPILTIPYTDVLGGHRGGDMAFGKDSYLYISTGDNGQGTRGLPGDPENNSQNSNKLFGKILRLDVDSPSPADNILQKIWALGLRNPWRFSLDKETGDLWLGDNGQDGWEEIDFLKAADVRTSRNFGWDYMEGNAVYRDCNCDISTTFIAPAFTFPGFTNNGGQSASVMGGYVYRGIKYPALKGSYFFGDYQSFKIGMIMPNGYKDFLPNLTYPPLISFGEDNLGELYVLSFFNGTLGRITLSNDPLPVKLEYFTAKEGHCSVQFEWKTSMETDFSHFEIERSVDGKSFVSLKSIPASGTNYIYQFTDEFPLQDKNLYRLKILDVDDSYQFSRIVSVNSTCLQREMSVFPNPALSLFTIKGMETDDDISIYNISGLKIAVEKSVSGDYTELNLNDYPQGIYMLNVANKSTGFVKKFKLVKE